MPSATATRPAWCSTASRSSRCGRPRSSAASAIWCRTRRVLPRRSRSPATAITAGSPSPSTTTGRAFRRICARRCSSRSCGSTMRAIRTRAAPGWAWPSRATSRARTAATSRSATARSGGLRATVRVPVVRRDVACRLCPSPVSSSYLRLRERRGGQRGTNRHRSSRKPAQRWPRASARSSAASVRARPGSSSSSHTRMTFA